MKHNVLFVSDVVCTYGGNFIESLKALEAEIKNRGGVALYAFPVQPKSQWLQELDTVEFFDWEYSSLKKLFDRCIEKYSIDIVHFHFVSSVKKILMSETALRQRSVSIYHLHNHFGSPKGIKGIIKSLMLYPVFDRCIKIGVSNSVSESIKRWSNKNVYTVINSIDFGRLNEINEQDNIVRLEDTVNLMIFGNHYIRKGVDIAAKAVRQLAIEKINVVLYIVASPSKHEKIKDYVLSFIDEETFNKNIKLITTRNDIASYYSKTDVFLSPSREEGFTYSVIEASYCGCEIVLSRCPGQTEIRLPDAYWINDPATDENISDEIVNAVKCALTARNSENYEEIIDKRKEYILQHYSLHRWVKDIFEIYDSNNR